MYFLALALLVPISAQLGCPAGCQATEIDGQLQNFICSVTGDFWNPGAGKCGMAIGSSCGGNNLNSVPGGITYDPTVCGLEYVNPSCTTNIDVGGCWGHIISTDPQNSCLDDGRLFICPKNTKCELGDIVFGYTAPSPSTYVSCNCLPTSAVPLVCKTPVNSSYEVPGCKFNRCKNYDLFVDVNVTSTKTASASCHTTKACSKPGAEELSESFY